MIKILYLLFIFVISFSRFSFAIDYNQYIFLNNSKQCSNYFPYIEEKYSIPKNLLRSISVIETGRWHSEAKLYFTWPWAVNQGGRAYYFSTKTEAMKAVKSMLERGLTNIDIGCMQINLHHHPDAFLDLEQAFDPKINIEYAAKFLINNYQVLNSWSKAVAYYHSQNSVGLSYADKVLKIHNDYRSNKLQYDFCTSATGELISCKNIIGYGKENLPPSFSSDTNNEIILSDNNFKPKKSSKRLKSNVISYSINN